MSWATTSEVSRTGRVRRVGAGDHHFYLRRVRPLHGEACSLERERHCAPGDGLGGPGAVEPVNEVPVQGGDRIPGRSCGIDRVGRSLAVGDTERGEVGITGLVDSRRDRLGERAHAKNAFPTGSGPACRKVSTRAPRSR